MPEPPRAGLTSAPATAELPEAFYRAFGYHVCGPRVIRFDMLERLADMIRPLLAWRSNRDPEAKPPKGSTGDGGFTATPEMMSILGCSPEELGKVLKALGFRLDRRPIKVPAPQPAAAVSVERTGQRRHQRGCRGHSGSTGRNSGAGNRRRSHIRLKPHPLRNLSYRRKHLQRPLKCNTKKSGGRVATIAKATTAAKAAMNTAAKAAMSTRNRGAGRNDNRRRDRRPGHPHQNPATSAPAAAGEAASPAVAAEGQSGAPANDQQHRADREPNRRGDNRGNRDPGQAQRQSPAAIALRNKGQQRNEGRPDRGDRGNRGDRGDRRRNDERNQPRAISAAPPRNKASAEADSPFASLLALRSQLEQARRDKS